MSASGLNVGQFAVQYSGAAAAAIAASRYDLIIVEAKPQQTGADLTDTDVAGLVATGRVIAGYVSVGQTDDQRPYWQAAWTDDGTDTGNPTAAAPDWLAEKAESWPAAIVEYWHPDWQAILLAQVTDIVTRGYNAIFLDNLLSYYEIASLRGELGTAQSQAYAADMMAFVTQIAATARAINPSCAIIANGGPYIIGDAGLFGTQAASDYLDAVDAIMAESFFGLLNDAYDDTTLDVFETFWAAQGIDVLALEYSTDPAAITAFATEAAARGFAASVSPTQALDVLPDPLLPAPEPITPQIGTRRADALVGTADDDIILGRGGHDTLRGLAGDDALRGNAGRDTLLGHRGDDTILGGSGADRLFGGKGADTLRGGIGDDDLFGGRGADTFVFDGRGDDHVTDFRIGIDHLLILTGTDLGVRMTAAGARIETADGHTMLFEGLSVTDVNDLLM